MYKIIILTTLFISNNLYAMDSMHDHNSKQHDHDSHVAVDGSKTKLELHHLLSVSELFNKWCTKNKVTTIDDVDYAVIGRGIKYSLGIKTNSEFQLFYYNILNPLFRAKYLSQSLI